MKTNAMALSDGEAWFNFYNFILLVKVSVLDGDKELQSSIGFE